MRAPSKTPGDGGRALLLPALVAGGLALLMLLTSLLTVAFSDYEEEALPAVTALLAGDLDAFFSTLPAYGGSLVMRAPFAVGADALGFGELGVARALALPCVALVALLAVAAWAELSRHRAAVVPAWIALVLVAANPLLIPALTIGHPEEALGAVLCVGAILLALRDRALLAGVALGLAGANKGWALFAVVPVLVALDGRRARVVATVTAGAVCGVVVAPWILAGSLGTVASASATETGEIFQPWQLWWFLGDHGETVRGLYAEKEGFRAASSFPGDLARPITIAVPLLVAAALAGRVSRRDAFLLLALCLHLRGLLDPWNTAYYALPLVFALVGHEVFVARRVPVLAGAVTALVHLGMARPPAWLSPDAQAALYLAWALPLAAVLTVALASPAARGALRRRGRALAGQLPALARLGGREPAGPRRQAPVATAGR